MTGIRAGSPGIRHGSRHNLSRDEYLSGGVAQLYAKSGQDLPHTKLTPEQIKEIRAAAEMRQKLREQITRELSNAALAERYGVHHRTIEKVLQFETHKGVL